MNKPYAALLLSCIPDSCFCDAFKIHSCDLLGPLHMKFVANQSQINHMWHLKFTTVYYCVSSLHLFCLSTAVKNFRFSDKTYILFMVCRNRILEFSLYTGGSLFFKDFRCINHCNKYVVFCTS